MPTTRRYATDADDLPKLCTAIAKARLVLRPWRTWRRGCVAEYAGRNWSDSASRSPVPVNLISLYVQVVSRALLPIEPRVLFSTFREPMKKPVRAVQDRMNHDIEHRELAAEMRRCVTDGLFSVGIANVSLADPAEAATYPHLLKVGMPYLSSVDLDDFGYDVFARDFKDADWICRRYRAPIDAVKDSRYYSSARRKLEPQPITQFNRTGDERIGVLGRGYEAGQDEAGDWVDLWQVYRPKERLILTLADDGGEPAATSEPLKVQEWVGPYCGPYHFLSLLPPVPGSAMPLSPLMNVYDLHVAENRVMNKIVDQTLRQKTLTTYQRTKAEDAARIQQTDDGEIVGVDDAASIREVSMGGPNQANYQMYRDLIDRFNYMSGNVVEATGGLRSQAGTAKQEELIQGGANQTVQGMMQAVLSFAGKCYKSYGWYLWNHPYAELDSEYQNAETGRSFSRVVYPQGSEGRGEAEPLVRNGSFDDIDVTADPYSVVQQGPEGRAAKLVQIWTQVVLPALPAVQEQGYTADIGVLLEKLAEYFNLPELNEIMGTTDPIPKPAGGDGGGMPAHTSRTYNRVSGSGQQPEAESESAVSAFGAAMKASGPNGRYQTAG